MAHAKIGRHLDVIKMLRRTRGALAHGVFRSWLAALSRSFVFGVCVCVCVCVHVCASVCVSVRGVSEVREREYVCKRCVTLGSVCVVV